MSKQQLGKNSRDAENQQGWSETASSTILRQPSTEKLSIQLNSEETIATVTSKGKEDKQQDASFDEMFVFSPVLAEMGDEFFEQVLIDTYAALEKELEEKMAGEVMTGTVDLNGSGASAVICLERKDQADETIVYTGSLGQCSVYKSTPSEIKQLSVKDEKRSFGNTALEEKNPSLHVPYVTRETLKDSDYIILASSGVDIHLKPSEVQEQRKTNAKDTAELIGNAVLARGAIKNTTVKVASISLPKNSIRVSTVFDGNGKYGAEIAQAMKKRVGFVFKKTMEDRLADNKKYNDILAKKNQIQNGARDLYADLNNPGNEFYYVAKIFQCDSDFAATLTAEDLQNHDSLTTAIDKSFNAFLNEKIKRIEYFDKKIKIWKEEILPNVDGKHKHVVNAQIKKLEALQEEYSQNKSGDHNQNWSDEVRITQLAENKKLTDKTKKITKEDESLFVLLYRMDRSIDVNLISLKNIQDTLQSRIDEIAKRLKDPSLNERTKSRLETENRSFPEKKSFLLSKTALRSTDTKDETDQAENENVIEKGESVEDELFRGKTQHVFFNGSEVTKDEFIRIKNKNENFREALKYYDPGMMGAGRPFLMNALGGGAHEASEANIYFSDINGEISCVGECKNYKYIDSVTSKEIIIPGSVFTFCEFNNNEGEKGFDWVGLGASNSLLNKLVNSLDQQKVTEADINKAKLEEEYQKAMALLKAMVNSLGKNSASYLIVDGIYKKIETINKEHSDVADLELLTRVATTVTELSRESMNVQENQEQQQQPATNPKENPALIKLEKTKRLLAEVHDKYDTAFSISLIVFFILIGVGLSFTGVGALAGLAFLEFAVDAAITLTSLGAGSFVFSGLLYKNAKDSRAQAETELNAATGKLTTTAWQTEANKEPQEQPQQQQQQQQQTQQQQHHM